MSRKLIVVLVGAWIITLAILLTVSVGAAVSTTTLGTDGHLASEDAAIEFRTDGKTTAEYVAPDVSVSAVQRGEYCDIEQSGLMSWLGFASDARNDYLCIQYNEDVERTMEVYVTQDIWAGYEREEVDAVAGGPHASFEPATIDGDRYLRVTVELDESGTFAYPVNRESVFLADRVDTYGDRAENVTGIGTADDEWRYVDSEDFGNNTTYVIQSENGTENLHVEWRYAGEDDDAWQVVPHGKEPYSPVHYEVASANELMLFTPNTGDHDVEVRYTEQPSQTTMFGSAWREIKNIPDRVGDLLGSLLG